MRNKLYFDIDGVFRDLQQITLECHPYEWLYKNKGLTLSEIVNNNLNLLVEAKPFDYLDIIPYILEEIVFLSAQPKAWREYTDKWLEKHVKIPYSCIYVYNGNDKLKMLEPGDYLIDDFPAFTNYRQIALIDRNWNKGIVCPLRISTPKELCEFINKN